MSKIALTPNASGTGTFTFAAPGTNTDRTLTLPDATGTVVLTDATQTLTNKTIQGGALTLGTAVASTSGTSIDFTGIPSWAKRVTVMFNGVSANGSSIPQIQLGDAGGVETTGYTGAASSEASTVITVTQYSGAGFTLLGTSSASTVLLTGHAVFSLIDATTNTWVGSIAIIRADAGAMHRSGGSKTLSATLDRVRVTTVNGTDTFDAGTINISYEG
jgi:hypothetical protein